MRNLVRVTSVLSVQRIKFDRYIYTRGLPILIVRVTANLGTILNACMGLRIMHIEPSPTVPEILL